MKNSVKGALLSGLICPGLGQIVLKHYKRGAVIMLAVLGSLAGIVVIAVQQALAILEKMELEGEAIDMDTITNAAHQASSGSGNLAINFLLLLIIGCWILGIVDAYRIGRGKDTQQCLSSQASNGNNS